MRLSQHLMKTMVIEESKNSPKDKLYSSPTTKTKNNDTDTSLMHARGSTFQEGSTFFNSASTKILNETLSTTLSSSQIKRQQNPFIKADESNFEQPSMFDMRNDDITQADTTTIGGHTASHLQSKAAFGQSERPDTLSQSSIFS